MLHGQQRDTHPLSRLQRPKTMLHTRYQTLMCTLDDAPLAHYIQQCFIMTPLRTTLLKT